MHARSGPGGGLADVGPLTGITSFGEQITLPAPTLTLLVFMPLAFSPVCSAEADELSTRLEEIAASGAQLFGVSCDSHVALRRWQELASLDFTLVSDFWPHGAIAKACGAFDEATGRPFRHTLLLDGQGTVCWQWRYPAGVARPVAEYLDVIRQVQQ